LAQEFEGVLVNEFVYGLGAVTALAHFEHGFGDGEGIADAPIAGAVHPDVFVAVNFHDVNGAGGRAFGFRVERHAGPETGVEDEFDGVFLDVIYDDTMRLDAFVAFDDINYQARAFEFVFEVRGVNEDELVVFGGEVDVFLENFDFVATVFVKADFADAENVGAVEKFGNDGEYVVGELEIFRFLGVDAEPGKVGQAEFGGAFGFVLRELTKVIVKTVGGTAVESSPKSWFANGLATGGDHVDVVVRGSAHHMRMRFDVTQCC